MAKSSTKKRKVIVDSIGEAHIVASFNNIIISLTNKKGVGILEEDSFYDFATFTLSSTGSSTEIVPFQNVAVVTVNHTGNLGTNPSVTVVNPNNLVIQGEVSYITNTQLTITFSSPQTGNVYLN